MDLRETTKLLSYVNRHDKRQVDELTIRDWHDLLGDLDYEDCYAAVRDHRLNSTEYLQVAHVRQGAKKAKAARAASKNHPAIESGPASFQRTDEQQADVTERVAWLRGEIAKFTKKHSVPSDEQDRSEP